jgi:hypothetical protein
MGAAAVFIGAMAAFTDPAAAAGIAAAGIAAAGIGAAVWFAGDATLIVAPRSLPTSPAGVLDASTAAGGC